MEDILDDLRSPDVDSRVSALFEVMNREKPEVELLLEVANLLKDTAAYVPSPSDSVLYLTTAFAPSVGAFAAAVLLNVGSKSSRRITDMINQIPSMEGDRRVCALDAIVSMGSSALQEAVQEADITPEARVDILEGVLLLRYAYPRMGAIAIKALASMGPASRKAMPSIAKYLNIGEITRGTESEHGGYCLVGVGQAVSFPSQVAATALKQMGPESIPYLADAAANPATSLLAIETLEEMGACAIPALLEALKSESAKTRTRAAVSIAHIGVTSLTVIDALKEATQSERGWLARRKLRKALRTLEKVI